MHAGSRQVQLTDEAKGIPIPVLVQYPTAAPAVPTPFGPYEMAVAPDAPPAPGRFPLVVVSHGSGGSPLLYRTVTTHLARHGYVVAMLEHPGNNRNDNRLDGTDENLLDRPRHVRAVIDALVADPVLGPSVRAEGVAVLGHSLGGYTGLVLAGGVPYTRDRRRLEVEADPRVRALVLLAPAADFFRGPDSLDGVTAPTLAFFAEKDPFTPPALGQVLRDGVPDPLRVAVRVVANAGHFSFLAPFPPAMRRPDFPPSTDPAGFDREAFHDRLAGEVVAFLDEHLGASAAA